MFTNHQQWQETFIHVTFEGSVFTFLYIQIEVECILEIHWYLVVWIQIQRSKGACVFESLRGWTQIYVCMYWFIFFFTQRFRIQYFPTSDLSDTGRKGLGCRFGLGTSFVTHLKPFSHFHDSQTNLRSNGTWTLLFITSGCGCFKYRHVCDKKAFLLYISL